MVTAALLLVAISGSHGSVPAWMDWQLAGYSFSYDDTHRPVAVHDPKTGFYLVRDVECDGGTLTLLLTRDHQLAAENAAIDANSENEADNIAQKRLPNLATGHGLRMGDSESRMKELLGKPDSEDIEGSRDQYVVYRYNWVDHSPNRNDPDTSYEQKYTFKKGTLIEIEFTRDSE